MQLKTTTLTTERLLLKEITPEFYEHMMSSFSDEAIKYFFGYETDKAFQQEQARHRNTVTCHYHIFKRFVLVDKESHKAIGQCGYHKWYQEHLRAEIGYGMNNESLMNMGYMREAIAPIVAFGFNDMELNRIEAFIGSENTASQKLVKRLGFQYEGTMREHYVHGGVAEDSMCFSLLRNEFNHMDKTPTNS